MRVPWDDTIKMDIPAVDVEHRQMFALLDQFFALVDEKAATATLARQLNDLLDYTAKHFQREELLLDRAGFPGTARHAAQHGLLLQQMGYFRESFAAGRATHELTLSSGDVFCNWLVDHIRRDDMTYRPYLKTLS